jgi:PAS domain S-box-containing protein
VTKDSDPEDAHAAVVPLRNRHRRELTRRSVRAPLTLHATDLGKDVLATLVESSADGIVILDAELRFVYVNASACRLLGYGRDDVLGRYGAAITPGGTARSTPTRRARAMQGAEKLLRTIVRSDGEERELDYSTVHFTSEGRPLVACILRDVTEQRRLERKSSALATVAASLTFAENLESTLDSLARSLVQATRSQACIVVLIHQAPDKITVMGSHGLPTGYPEAMLEAGRAGAPLATLHVFQSRQPLVIRDARAFMRGQPHYAAVRHFMQIVEWDVVVSLPLLYQDRTLGSLNVYYLPGATIGKTELDFLTAIASQASIAIENARLFAEAQDKAALEERQHLARELHDSVSQTLFSAGLIAEVLPQLWQREPKEGEQRLEELRQLTRGALAEMRMLLLELRPTVLTQVPLNELLRQLADATTGRARLPVALEYIGSPRLLLPEAQIGLYRIAQECLNNVVKHAGAKAANVRLAYEPEAVELEVCDDGSGFVADAHGAEHLGLKIMRERAAAIGADLTVHSRPREGTRVVLRWVQAKTP